MKKHYLFYISAILVMIGAVLLLYPPISNNIEKEKNEQIITTFNQIKNNVVENPDKDYKTSLELGEINEQSYPVGDITDAEQLPVLYRKDLNRLLRASKEYNDYLKRHQRELLVDEVSYLNAAVNLNDYGIHNGIFGYISAEKIGMELPIYLGANDSNMRVGAAHLNYTSLPIGGESANCVLSAHSGYIGKLFFDGIGNLNTGDSVKVTNYWQTLNYKVVDKKIYKPDDSEKVFIVEGKDLLTLITCVSNETGGFDRLYVICEKSS